MLVSSGDTPLGQLPPQAWMNAAATRRVIEALCPHGEVRFVGGCVRDALAHRNVHDIDLATPLRPEQVMVALKKAGIKAIPTGLSHGTVTAVVDGGSFEITTLRRDVSTDGRHATVAFTDSWREDASRRDFTMNALSATPDGQIYDYFEGLTDLSHGTVRFVGDAGRRIREDYLRLLRFFRFHAHYGRPPADQATVDACRANLKGLGKVSAERVRNEILRLLLAPDPIDAVTLMRGHHVLNAILPEAGALNCLRALVFLETRALAQKAVFPDPLRRLAALLEGGAEAASGVAQRLRLSNTQTVRLQALMAGQADLTPALPAPRQRVLFNTLGPPLAVDVALLNWARLRAVMLDPLARDSEGWITLLEGAAAWEPRACPVTGQDVLDHGVPSGPQVGDLLDRVRTYWEEHDMQPDRARLLTHLKQCLADEGLYSK